MGGISAFKMDKAEKLAKSKKKKIKKYFFSKTSSGCLFVSIEQR